MYVYEHGQRLQLPPRKPSTTGPFMRMTKTRQPVIWNTAEEGDEQTGGVVPGTDRSRSGVMIPIISSDRVLGIVQLENYERDYAYGESELRLLTTIAASLGSALENARLFDETQRLFKAEQERVAELQIINSIQQVLAAELDFQAIVDLVGDKLREVLKTGDMTISWWDERANLVHYLYVYEHGKRIIVPPYPPTPGGIYEIEMKTRQPYVMDFESIKKYPILPGTDFGLSSVNIPIISSDRFLGDIAVENFERENAFGEMEIRLLTTIAASLGTALENARLFDETQRLLKETEQRNAELAILNSVGEALSKQLDVDAIIKIVGDKVRDTFKSEVTTLQFYDQNTNLITSAYAYDRGYVIPPTLKYGEGLTSVVIRTRQPLVLLDAETEPDLGEQIIPNAMGQDGLTESYLGVPIIVGENVIGVSPFKATRKMLIRQAMLICFPPWLHRWEWRLRMPVCSRLSRSAWQNCKSSTPSSRGWQPSWTSRRL
jgi:GAF domain-containing protein